MFEDLKSADDGIMIDSLPISMNYFEKDVIIAIIFKCHKIILQVQCKPAPLILVCTNYTT